MTLAQVESINRPNIKYVEVPARTSKPNPRKERRKLKRGGRRDGEKIPGPSGERIISFPRRGLSVLFPSPHASYLRLGQSSPAVTLFPSSLRRKERVLLVFPFHHIPVGPQVHSLTEAFFFLPYHL